MCTVVWEWRQSAASGGEPQDLVQLGQNLLDAVADAVGLDRVVVRLDDQHDLGVA